MRLLDSKSEKSHFRYYLIYQVFKPHFSSKNETLILFFEKKNFFTQAIDAYKTIT